MTTRALVALVRQNLSRSRRSFALSVFGISVGIASKLLQRNVSKEDNERLIEETFKQLEATRAAR